MSTHAANQVLTARGNMQALNIQLKDQETVEKIDEALDYYATLFTSKQYLFCVNLSLGATPKQAMQEAGYESCSAAHASRLLDLHNSRMNIAYQLMLKRRHLSEGVSKRWAIAKLVHLCEEAQERGELKTSIAAVRELNLMTGNHAPTNIRVDQAVSVAYEFIGLPGSNMPGIREIIAVPTPKTELKNIIESKPLSSAGVEFCTHKIPDGY